MNILLVASGNFFSTYGGGQVYVKNLVDGLVRQGIYPIIATPGNPGDVPGDYSGCAVHTFVQGAVEAELQPLLNKIKPDVVHVHGHKAAFSSACAALGIPCIVTAHHGGILCPAGTLLNHKDQICRKQANDRDCLPCVLKNIRGGLFAWPLLRVMPLKVRLGIGRWLKKSPFIFYLSPVGLASLGIDDKIKEWRAICKSARLLVAPSHAISESMTRNGVQRGKIIVIPHGTPLPETTLPSPGGMVVGHSETHPLRFFFVGRICHVKGVHIMLEAFDQITGSTELHIVGGAGNKTEQRYMKQLITRYKSNPRITWHGKIPSDKVSEWTARFDVMIHPAICLEVFGLNIAEALALGKPVIATRCGGAEMQIENGVNGWLVEPNDIDGLSSVLRKVVRNPDIILRLGRSRRSGITPLSEHIASLVNIYNHAYYCENF